MAIYTIELDARAEAILKKLMAATGVDEATAIQQALLDFEKTFEPPGVTQPFEIYRQLDLGEGGYAACPADQSRQGIVEMLQRKQHR